MRKLFIVCTFLLAFSLMVFSQDDYQTADLSEMSQSEKAEKIDEFGKLGECEFGARFDNLLATLQNKTNAEGYIIFYQGKDVLPAEYGNNVNERRARNHIAFRNFDSAHLTFVNGGFREEVSTELWIVPNGAEPPVPTDTIPKPIIPSSKTFLYDRNLISGNELGDFSEEFILASVKAQQEAEQRAYEEENQPENADVETAVEETIQTVEEETEIEQSSPEEIEEAKFYWTNEKFGGLIKNQKDSSGVIIFYADDAYYDVGKLQRHIEDGRRKIAEAAKISHDKIQVIFGGYRNFIEAEFWIVPKKGESPKPTPEERPIEEENN